MMRPANDIPAVYLCRKRIDFRCGINTLAVRVESTLRMDPFAERLYVFCTRSRFCTGNGMASSYGRTPGEIAVLLAAQGR
jgi:transposase